MAFTPQEGAEPISGYQLLSPLGSGGFGEVWKCTAPGGLTKALKIVFGHMRETRADQELKALNRIKEVRHPFLLSLERIEILDGQLFIITELADMSLWDRYQHYEKGGMPGIPREELLGYIRDAADVLDYLRENHDLQHLDIKPQNLLLVGGRIKIADFGLVKHLNATSVTATGGVTPVYAPPEAFDGRVTMYSDQYSLAIVYQEMLTGIRPFPGTTALQLAAQHASSLPLLDPLPVQDRLGIGRALSKIPEQRFPSCREMVQSLLSQHPGYPPGPATWAEQAAEVKPPGGPFPGQEIPSEPAVPWSTAQREQLLAMDTETNLKPVKVRAPAPTGLPVPPAPAPKSEKTTKLRPTLFLGVGGLAGATLRRLKRRLHQGYPALANIPVLGWLLLDTDRQALHQARQGESNESLSLNETLYLPLHPPEYYRDQAKDLLRWLERRWLYGIPRSLLTEGLRPLGRLALCDNLGTVLERLRETLRQICAQEAKARTTSATGLPLRDEAPRIFLIASIAGGSGGGMFLDLAYLVRQLLRELRQPDQGLCGLLLFATGPQPAARELARLNAWVALQEFQHFCRPDTAFPGEPEKGLHPSASDNSPFQDCYLVQLGDQVSEALAHNATALLADYLYLDTVTPAGTFLDRHRRNTFALPNRPEQDTFLRTLGMSQIHFPKRQLARQVANLLCQHVVDGWRGEPEADNRFPERGLPTLGCARDLETEFLVEKLKAAVQVTWGEEPESYLRKLLADVPVQPAEAGTPQAKQQQLGKIEAVFAAGEAESATLFQTALHQAREQQEKHLAEAVTNWLVAIVESPGRRLRAADRAARWLLQHLATALEIAQTQHAQQLKQCQSLRAQVLAPDKTSAIRWLGFRRPQGAGTDPQQLFVHYGLFLFEMKVLEKAAEVLNGITKHLLGWNQSLAHCSQRLHHLVATLRASLAEGTTEVSAAGQPNVRELFPGDSDHVDKAAEEVFRTRGKDMCRSFDEKFQAETLDPAGGLWGILSGTGDVLTDLWPKLQAGALEAILDALQDIDAAGLFLERHADKEQIYRDLQCNLQAAAPALEAPREWRHLLLGVPTSPAGTTLVNIVFEVLKDLPITLFETEGEVILCQEAARLSLQKIAASLVGDSTSDLATAAQHLLTRRDVAWSHLPQPRKS